MGVFKDIVLELGLTEDQLKDKQIQKFAIDCAARKQTGDWYQYWNGNGYCELNKKDGTMITTVLTDEPFKAEFPLNCDMNISNKCSNGCSFCLTEEAKLYVGDIKTPINKIKEGDLVNSYNLTTHDKELKHVTHLFERDYDGELIELCTENGDILKLTPNHKVYTQRGYVRADEITLDDELISELNE